MALVEILVPAITAIALCGFGSLLFRYVAPQGHAPPAWVALGAAIVTFVVYLSVVVILWQRSEGTGLFFVAFYCVVFWTLPVVYYARALLRALEENSMSRYTWLSMKIPDEDVVVGGAEIHEARALASQGDIQGAVSEYKTSPSRRRFALFSAARLLEADGDYDEAAELYGEVASQSFSEDLAAWSEAIFRLAKLLETRLDDPPRAIVLLDEIVTKAPSTEYGAMAFTHLTQLHRADQDSVRKAKERVTEGDGGTVGPEDSPRDLSEEDMLSHDT